MVYGPLAFKILYYWQKQLNKLYHWSLMFTWVLFLSKSVDYFDRILNLTFAWNVKKPFTPLLIWSLLYLFDSFLILLVSVPVLSFICIFIIMCFTCSSSSFCLYVYPFICENWVQRSNSAQVNFICLWRGGQFTKPCFTCKLIIKLHNSMNFANLIG